ncbi:hypothetical protein CY652_01610 [Burkholderia sp. WAC0059]|uniref:hypothetical protein n=1 Tax=Burkholderia sp. WAC0059 TaxID=2066022 RepID=UPI000C7EF7BE|nr:hypothetical protein [Burkholderia sp. WAC0059]PLZ04385.1 hypothetical protein CY652_01610 [Burkholderia sp. WAC0059]
MNGECFIDGERRRVSGPVFSSRDTGAGETVWRGAGASANDVTCRAADYCARPMAPVARLPRLRIAAGVAPGLSF